MIRSRLDGMLDSLLTDSRSQTASRLSSKSGPAQSSSPKPIHPVLAHVVGRPEAPGVVHDGAAAEARAGEQADALVAGGDPAAAEVQVRVAGELGPVEVLLGEVSARLDHDNVEPGRGEHTRGGAAAGAGADHDDIALELCVLGDLQGLDRLGRRVRRRAERPGVAERLIDRVRAVAGPGKGVVTDQGALAQSLEGGALLDRLGVGPREQRLLAVRLRHRGERRPALARGDRVPGLDRARGTARARTRAGCRRSPSGSRRARPDRWPTAGRRRPGRRCHRWRRGPPGRRRLAPVLAALPL